jgi:hypothetical protein
MNTSFAHPVEFETVVVVHSDDKLPLFLCTHVVDAKGKQQRYWYQLWTLAKGKSILDVPFDNFRPEQQEYRTAIPLMAKSNGLPYRFVEADHILEWVADRNSRWSVKPSDDCDPALPCGSLSFEFSFDDLVVATEFQLRWG